MLTKIKNFWTNASKGKKTAIIISIIFWIAALTFSILVIFAKDLFGADSFLASILKDANGDTFDMSAWFKANSDKFLKSIFYIVIILGATKLIRWLLGFVFTKSKKAITIVKLLNSFLKYVGAIALILVLLGVWGVDPATLLASAGILALVIGLGAQSLISDIIAGLFIVFENDYQVGDIVVVDDFRGTVQQIGIRTTKVEDAGGNVKIIGNSKITSIVNMTNDLSVAICDMSIEYDESLERVENILHDSFDDIKKKIPAIKEGPFYMGVQELGDSAVIIRIVAKTPEEDKFQVNRSLNRELKIIFDKNNINIPFNQIVINTREEKKEEKVTTNQKNKAEKFVEQQMEETDSIKNIVE